MKMEYRYAGMDILYQLVLIRTETVREKGALKSVRKPAYDGSVRFPPKSGGCPFERSEDPCADFRDKRRDAGSGLRQTVRCREWERSTYRLRADGAAGQTGFRGHKRTQNGWNRLLWLKFPGFQRKKRDWRNRPG